MNFSYNWLSELVGHLDIKPNELTALITMKTAECEGVHSFAPWLAEVCAARVESVDPIEGSKNVKAIVETGRYGRRQVVCGAPNCRPGIVTAYVPVGATISGREIREAVIGGIESEGMLASGAELGVNRESEGILELLLEPGASLGVQPDWIIEVDNKSLTHRPDLWGHYGMAREVAAITGNSLRDPINRALLPDGSPSISVRVLDPDLCPRYSALVFDNVTVQPSPLWLQARLEAVGLNPINNIVDVTNYVMAELAQPMHAFDAAKLHGSIIVRRADAGEQIRALNGETYELHSSNLVIADEECAIAIAGVIGGQDSAISSETKRIVLESANFQASSVRKTSSLLKLRTDASMRFEKAQDPANTVRGLMRAIALLTEVSPGIRVAGGLADVAAPVHVLPPVQLDLNWLDRKLGRHVDAAEVKQILRGLEFGVTESAQDEITVTVPSWRATKDIAIREDLAEEIGRMIGYGTIPPQAPLLPATVPPVNATRRFHHGVRELATAQGFDEVYNYSFISEDTIRRFSLDPDEHVRVRNPIAADQTHLRTSLIPGICRNIVDNARYLDDFCLFEIGVEIHKRATEGLPHEINHLAAAAYRKHAAAEHLFDLKHLALMLDPDIDLRPSKDARVFEHPSRVASLHLRGESIGRLFELHPEFLERGRAGILDIDMDALMRLTSKERRYSPVQRFPSSAFDLSVVAPERSYVGDIRQQLERYSGPEVISIEYVRQYSGAPLPEGTKSVSWRFTVAAPDRTLSSEEVSVIRQRIIDGMLQSGYELRV